MRIKRRGMALVFALVTVLVLTVLGSLALFRSISENRISRVSLEEAQALLLADAGVNRAQYQIRQNFNLSGSNLFTTSSSPGKYNFDVSISSPFGVRNYTVIGRGCLPANCNCTSLPNNCNMTREVKASMNEYQNTPGFYANAIYSAGNIAIGNDPVGGDVLSGGTVTGPVDPGSTITQNDPTLQANGLPSLDFESLRQTSIDQGWYNASTNVTTYPTSFWKVAPSPSDLIGVPNVVFVNGDFSIAGGKQVVGGFVVVGGNTIYDAAISGNASIDGCLYTRGDIVLNGGGGPTIVNITGGVWAGGTVSMNGNPHIDYNESYMYAIRDALHPNTDVRIIAWLDTQNSYNVSP
ncbi:MAG: hypothetical protein Q7J37_02635 [Candidatus Omnitrophota bacterium]|nr:hypothetical protein [Candidatus Omnitrophota bacterium]